MGYEGRSSVVAGVIPWSDSYGYTSDALRLVHGAHFANIAARRPLFSLVLSCLLRLTDENLRATVVLLSVIGALAVTAATTALWRTHGPKAALVLYGVPLSLRATLGWPLPDRAPRIPARRARLRPQLAGARSSALVPPAARGCIASSLLALGLGLFARPGPFFVLPALLGCGRGGRRRIASALSFSWISAIALTYVVNSSVVRGLGTGHAYGDYPTILYGLVHDEELGRDVRRPSGGLLAPGRPVRPGGLSPDWLVQYRASTPGDGRSGELARWLFRVPLIWSLLLRLLRPRRSRPRRWRARPEDRRRERATSDRSSTGSTFSAPSRS